MAGERPAPADGNAPAALTRPPVSDEIDWRARALEAESKIAQLDSDAQALRTQLAQAQSALAQEKQSRELDRALAAAGAIDPEVASLLLTNMLASQPPAQTNAGEPTTTNSPPTPDINTLIQTLRTQKPFLFESALPPRPTPSAMSPALITSPPDSLTDLATQARTGDRRSLLAYLRARRATP
ncbi:MAG: hypothetical protein JNK16_04645 [Phycisphaerales bacterium]|nr:hypothetical protein [Phycisphaerales bacterium]